MCIHMRVCLHVRTAQNHVGVHWSGFDVELKRSSSQGSTLTVNAQMGCIKRAAPKRLHQKGCIKRAAPKMLTKRAALNKLQNVRLPAQTA
jgi:hypothetical protein